ncbi:alpha/beta fold hydrolase [Afipia sp. GAS231]|uniref:alpha/beta fold hydrolase n=1 Tax=Afipia sp. GAS231 TaxID=1882747 RepID=UPI00087B7E70|nr:alpha/beta hydrolase [Afipia sp. GAS231]SDO66712.1 Pimeloyl-ACP methyl ester carboxylesterase [Afipia sp. GAS231]
MRKASRRDFFITSLGLAAIPAFTTLPWLTPAVGQSTPQKAVDIITTTVQTNGLNFKVRESGGKDPALVFLHYWGGSGRTWDMAVNQLSELHRCVAPDLRGWGGSDRSIEDYSLNAQADDVGAIIQSLGLTQYILVGHSSGAKIAQIFGARKPVGLKGLVLVAPSPPTPSGAPQEQKDGMLKSYQSAEGVKMALPHLTARQLSPELQQQVVEDSVNGTPAAKRAWPQEGMALDISNLVGNIDVPTTIIVGDADKVEPEPVLRREFGSRIKNAEFVILPGVGHLAPLEAPNELAAAITKAVSRSL